MVFIEVQTGDYFGEDDIERFEDDYGRVNRSGEKPIGSNDNNSTMDPAYLNPTAIIDSDHPRIVDYAREVAGEARDPVEQAVRIYYAVRDGIRYDPYYPFYLPEHYRASNVLASGRGYCVCKASLLCALGRSLGIPSRVGFATVRNHLATKQLIEFLGSDLFVYHGYTDFFLEGKWVKATPAFNKELCVTASGGAAGIQRAGGFDFPAL